MKKAPLGPSSFIVNLPNQHSYYSTAIPSDSRRSRNSPS